MIDHFADRLLKQCHAKGAPVCVGIDPVFARLPADLRHNISDAPGSPDAQTAADAIARFSLGVIEAVAQHVPAVKIQLACFERFGPPGLDAYQQVVAAAKKLQLIVIADAKRGDIGISSAHYAAALLDGPTGADALTVNAYLGADALEPFVELAAAQGKGLFALVRTSNPGSDAIQSLQLADGRNVAQAVADVVTKIGSNHIGAAGFSLMGAVVGATHVEDIADLRKRMPQTIFLVPGYGAQGATAKDVKACFTPTSPGSPGSPTGALITASRSIIYAFNNDSSNNWQPPITRAAKEFNQQIRQILT